MSGGRRPVDSSTRARVLELFEAGDLGRNEIAREVGLAAATISGIAREVGHEFDRSKSRVAIQARAVDIADMRSMLAKASLLEAFQALEDMHAPAIMVQFEAGHQTTRYDDDGKPVKTENTVGSFREHILDEPTFSDKRNLATIYGIMISKAAELTKTTAAAGSAESISYLETLAEGLKLVAKHMSNDPSEDPTVVPTATSREELIAQLEADALESDPDDPDED